MFASFCALGVAFFPTTPDHSPTKRQSEIGTVHYVFAALLFLTLAYFCLILFRKTADPEAMTRKKQQRNQVYTICGFAILTSILFIVVSKIPTIKHRVEHLNPVFWFETSALVAFGIAWLVKGETFLKDVNPRPSMTKTTDNILLMAHRNVVN
jgi:hypothetical protein